MSYIDDYTSTSTNKQAVGVGVGSSIMAAPKSMPRSPHSLKVSSQEHQVPLIKEGFEISQSESLAAEQKSRDALQGQATNKAVKKTGEEYEKILEISNLSERISIPAELQMYNNMKMSVTNVKNGQQNKITLGFDKENKADQSGEIFANDGGVFIHGMGASGNDRKVFMKDTLNVAKSIDTPLMRINGKNAFDFTSDGALRINPAGTGSFNNVRVDSILNVNGPVVGNSLCLGNSTTCFGNDELKNIKTVPTLTTKIDNQYLTMDQAVKKSTEKMEANLGSKCSTLNSMVEGGSINIPRTDLRFNHNNGRGNGGRALVHDGGNQLTINYGNDFSRVNVNSSMSVRGDVNVQNKLFFRDDATYPYPSGHNNSDPYHMEKVQYGGNNSALRMTINDDWDESFQIWGDSCRTTGCWGPGVPRHIFRADGQSFHGDVINTPGIVIAGRWRLSDTHGDSWLRMYNPGNNWYYGGIATNYMWANGGQYYGSDIKLKEDLVKLDGDDMLEKIKRMDGYRYTLKSDQKKHYGLIAQYLEKEFPEMVIVGPDQMKGVDYQQLIPVLLNTIKTVNEKADRSLKALEQVTGKAY
jgi:hypothetical protein